MEERRQAVGYIRVSTSEQASSGLSLEAQRRKVNAQAELSDLTLIGVLEDAGESACTLKRPAMTELLARIDSGQVDAVIIGKLDRLTRSVKDLSILLERMKKARRADGGKGVDLISTAESWTPAAPPAALSSTSWPQYRSGNGRSSQSAPAPPCRNCGPRAGQPEIRPLATR